MNRCIHCTRCIRFGDEVAGIHEMVAIKRGNNIDITTIDGEALKTEYAGNYADICPTGSLTLKDFRFKKRAWMLKKTESVCEGCSKGCNIELQHEGGVIYRTIPRENMAINKYWMCDEGRFNYRYTQDPTRVLEPKSQNANTSWEQAVASARSLSQGKKVLVLVGTDLTLEEMSSIAEFVKMSLPGAVLQHFGNAGVPTSAEDGPADALLKMKSKTSNLKGAEKLGIAPYSGSKGFDVVWVFRGGRAEIPAIESASKVGVGVFMAEQAASFAVILPGLAFTEKDGTVINHQGVEQRLKRAVTPKGRVKATGEILMLLTNTKAKAGVA